MSFFEIVIEACKDNDTRHLIDFLNNNPDVINTIDTAIEIAQREDNAEIVELLQGYDLELTKIDLDIRESIFFMSGHREEIALKALLRDNPVYINDGLRAAALFGWEEMVHYALENGADFHYAPEGQNNAFHNAVGRGHINIIELFVFLDPEIIKTLNGDGISALNVAILHGKGEVVNWLVGMGVDINNIDILGNNALHYAMEIQDLTIIELLLGHGVNINVINDQGQTPLDMAREIGGEIAERLEIAALVLENIGHIPNISNLLDQGERQITAADIIRVNQEMTQEMMSLSSLGSLSIWPIL